mmetsp:Transcript_4428/g.5130  ORF Transcript_4428/g.5130 Transcript_4428/m.5130 type:complete len:341 (+) Transcript_4428:244-1266(+)|eukprot:CAMPEP_0197843966 /NCGR_PEP_ID=MMETSP1438-20131217/942_1 /TAXON_ID=1461541 /ORGANISM="Pterosperma sp., Strain CCMP1384" /LENGTH=340 /DNA_ID=CAMNT_0043454469 /DNA_START=240 /DNA_END=1262 /DNA_ORIENTATION=-
MTSFRGCTGVSLSVKPRQPYSQITSSLPLTPHIVRSHIAPKPLRFCFPSVFPRGAKRALSSQNNSPVFTSRSFTSIRCTADSDANNGEDVNKNKALLESIWKKDESGGPDNELKSPTDILDDKIDGAVRKAEEVCDKGTQADCAVAWEEVEELADARNKKSKRDPYSNPPKDVVPTDKNTPKADASQDDPSTTTDTVDEGAQEGLGRDQAQNPAIRLMSNEMPCNTNGAEGCEPPTGTFEQAAAMEAMLNGGVWESGSDYGGVDDSNSEDEDDEDDAELKSQLQGAISDAEQACKDGTTADCAVAWDQVEEISSEASRREKRKKGNKKAKRDSQRESNEG